MPNFLDYPGAGYLIPLAVLSLFFCAVFVVALVLSIHRCIAAYLARKKKEAA